MTKLTIIAALTGLAFATAAGAAPRQPLPPQATIPFARTITDFRTVGRDTVYIRATGRQWYRADLIGPCLDLPFVQALGFEHRGTPGIDRFSTLIVRRGRCPLRSLTKVAGPPAKSARPKRQELR
ncbi:DUF6491 family protein [Sphingomonas jatrophae]|uniref:KTSC domain-containing protein n=1 Tax=Sphingomonas jatrophae TaxID=1166337 RepID=A0A1I6M2M8_9SPHN|nr:DUF6491 family protein [Sphingomonas jatrophae]SFS09949.1 hypothetical protein SAMN05192580_3348 [Sphingomonas jatrophae]